MKLSSLLHKMGKTDMISVGECNKKTSERLYEGTVRGILRDDPLNTYRIRHIVPGRYMVFISVEIPRKEESDNGFA